jgi:ribosomal protein L21
MIAAALRRTAAAAPRAKRCTAAPRAAWRASSTAATKVLHRDPETPAPASGGDRFAVVRLGGTQYKITKDDLIVAEKLDVQVGADLVIDEVLLVGSDLATVVGRPTVQNATVTCAVEEQTRDAKVVVFKKRRRQNSRRRNGHRRHVTLLRVTDIDAGEGSDII